jgi:anti-anti-sigma factor
MTEEPVIKLSNHRYLGWKNNPYLDIRGFRGVVSAQARLRPILRSDAPPPWGSARIFIVPILTAAFEVERVEMKELEITLQHLESTVVVHAVGPVDSDTASQLQQSLLGAVESHTGAVELDLAKVPYMSSAGLRVLMLAAKALQKRGGRLRLANVPVQTYNVLNLAGFTSFIDIKQ